MSNNIYQEQLEEMSTEVAKERSQLSFGPSDLTQVVCVESIT